jgi:hypothetical protein
MLRLRIDSRALNDSWQWSGGEWVNGNSWIRPFIHPSLEAAASTGPSGTVFTVRERMPTGVAVPPPASAPGDFTSVEIDTRQHRVHVSTGAFGSAPVYVCQRDGILHGSWDLTELPLSGMALNEREIARLLTLRLRYTAETVFTGVYRVTERATVSTGLSGQVQIRYPAPALHSAPRRLVPGADVTGAYEDLLRAVVSEHAYDPGATLVELSGGVDSANTALTLAALTGGHLVTPGAMILDGKRAAQQIPRRRELIRACGFTGHDITVRATAHPPLHPAGLRASTGIVSPYDEPYHEAMTALHQAAAAHGIRHVFTGIGGDEMVSVPRTEAGALPLGTDRPFMPWITSRTRQAAGDADSGIAPASQVNEMTLIAIGCAAPVILGAGSWPVHPLADPRLVTFGEWLPVEWRERKRLHRERLSRHGLSQYVTRPPIPEVFTGIMDIGLRSYGAELGRKLASRGGLLIGAGYVSAARLAEACDRISSRTAQPRDREVFDVLALETAVAALTGDTLPGTVAACS